MPKKVTKFKKIRRRIRYTFVYLFIRAMISVSRVVPRVAWIKVFGWFGGLSYWLAPKSRRLVREHLQLAYQDEMDKEAVDKLTKEVFVMMGRNASEVIRNYRLGSMAEMDKIRRSYGMEHAEKAYTDGNGLIFLVAHIGAFELLATEMALRGYKPFIVGTPLKDPRLHDLLWSQRSKLGATAIERGKDTVRLVRNLKSGGSMAILIDQDTRVKSRFVNFFGVPCATPIGATILALKTGAKVVPIFIHQNEQDYMHEIWCYPPVELEVTGDDETDLIVNTQKFTDVIEAEVRKYPSQWVWMHERWKTKPGQEIV